MRTWKHIIINGLAAHDKLKTYLQLIHYKFDIAYISDGDYYFSVLCDDYECAIINQWIDKNLNL